jgi:hypothetical protein
MQCLNSGHVVSGIVVVIPDQGLHCTDGEQCKINVLMYNNVH